MVIFIKVKYINHKNMGQVNINIIMEINLEDIGDMMRNKDKVNFGVRKKLVIVVIGIIISL